MKKKDTESKPPQEEAFEEQKPQKPKRVIGKIVKIASIAALDVEASCVTSGCTLDSSCTYSGVYTVC